jgi:predicted Rossmann fold nucleotide-binding protein DprA/Smf involved in DNA uptake
VTRNERPVFSPLARVVFNVLRVAPGTVEDLARETKLPLGVVDVALIELRNAGRAERMETGRWRAR